MCRRLIYCTLFVLAIVSTSAHADLAHYWKLDEDTAAGATIVVDSVGGNDGTINGATTAEGKVGNAFYFDGSATIEIANFSTANLKSMTMTFWMNPDVGYTSTGGYKRVISANDGWEVIMQPNSGLLGNNLYRTGGTYVQSTVAPPEGEWTHVAMTADLSPPGTGLMEIYLNGEFDASMENQVLNDWGGGTFLMGYRFSGGGEHYQGLLDDVRIYNEVLSAEEIKGTMEGVSPAVASRPSPADGATDVPRDVVLSWTPAEFAPPTNGHTVYFSENFNEVNNGIGGITQDANSYTPAQRLDIDKTYYWRVDEVNGPPDYTVFEGSVWSFTTEPVAYAIANVTATASSNDAGKGPENTINGSGLDETGLLHDVEATNMWLSSRTGAQPTWIEFQFNKVYKLHEMWVWNSNDGLEQSIGFGFKDVIIEYSADGNDYTTLGTTHEFAQAPGAPDYPHNTTVDFSGVAAKYVRLTANSNWGGFVDQYGLSEVRFFYIPVRAREPSPDSGATDVDVDVTLSWRAGREAAEHDVYLGTDEQAVTDGNAPVTTVTEARDGPLSLDLGATYYWKVNEVNMAETATMWDGDLWNFTTSEYLVVDDFEGYSDYPPDEIFSAWIDGWGTQTNGALIAHDQAPWAETVIVHSGRQSMPYRYDNNLKYSEAERPLDPPQDWTRNGVGALSLWFYGDPNNAAERMYVAIANSPAPAAVVYHDDQNAAQINTWTEWLVDLSKFADQGVNLQNVNSISIGFGDKTNLQAGGSGLVFFDDIRKRQ